MGRFSHDLWSQLVSRVPRLLACQLPCCVLFHHGEASLLETEPTVNASLAFLEQGLPSHLLLVLQCPLHLNCPLLYLHEAFPCSHSRKQSQPQNRTEQGFNSAGPGGPRWGRWPCSLPIWGQIPSCFPKPHPEVLGWGRPSREVSSSKREGA